MKYSESSSKSKFTGSAAFYIIIACCLVAIGGASWFAVSNYNKDDVTSKSSSQSNPESSYKDNSSAYNSNIANPSSLTPSADVAEPVKDEPYSSVQESSSVPPVATNTYTMPVQGEIIKNYNEKELQYSATLGDMRVHTGIDIACENGTAVSACSNGTVLSVEANNTFGNVVTIDHGNGITVKYSCLKDIKTETGKTVSVGDIIGSVDTIPSESADQSHLHLEVYKNGHIASPLATLGLE